jgi:hypothetical protein
MPLIGTYVTVVPKVEREQLQRKSFFHIPSQALHNKVRAVRVELLLYSELTN